MDREIVYIEVLKLAKSNPYTRKVDLISSKGAVYTDIRHGRFIYEMSRREDLPERITHTLGWRELRETKPVSERLELALPNGDVAFVDASKKGLGPPITVNTISINMLAEVNNGS